MIQSARTLRLSVLGGLLHPRRIALRHALGIVLPCLTAFGCPASCFAPRPPLSRSSMPTRQRTPRTLAAVSPGPMSGASTVAPAPTSAMAGFSRRHTWVPGRLRSTAAPSNPTGASSASAIPTPRSRTCCSTIWSSHPASRVRWFPAALRRLAPSLTWLATVEFADPQNNLSLRNTDRSPASIGRPTAQRVTAGT